MSCYVFAAGGTGGHVVPAVTVAEELVREEPQAEIHFIGSGAAVEIEIVGRAGFRHHIVPFVPLRGKGLLGCIKAGAVLPKSMFRCLELYSRIKPCVVIGFGGFPTIIPGLCACLSRIPLVVHEQNGETGLANRLLSLFAAKVFAAPGAAQFFRPSRVEQVSNPVRRQFYEVPEWCPERLRGKALSLLVVGGSQGAVSLNDAVISLYPFFAEHGLEVVHQSGAKDLPRVEAALTSCPGLRGRAMAFIQDMAGAYAQADLVICRAGAMTAAEVSAAGRAALFVPLPIAGGHQEKNITHLLNAGASRVFHHGEDLSAELKAAIFELQRAPELIQEMAVRARNSAMAGADDLWPAQRITAALRALA